MFTDLLAAKLPFSRKKGEFIFNTFRNLKVSQLQINWNLSTGNGNNRLIPKFESFTPPKSLGPKEK